jgi:regulator of extracellular matrix RemA (YlzA/DUF370 family)
MKLINIGFGNMVNAERVVCVVSPESAPIKRIIQQAKDQGKLIDVTQGRKTASVILTDSEHILLSYLKADKISLRFEENQEE